MGMFDELKCEYPLPDAAVQEETFQTKSLNRVMDRYTITQEGRLILHKVRYEVVPEEEREYYGTPEWDEKPFVRIFGMLRSIPVGDVEIPYHGDIAFYTSTGSREEGDFEWFEYQARFTEGRLQSIRRVPEQPWLNRKRTS
jgi:hypothetical protein